MIYKVGEMSVAQLETLARDGKSPESRWLASRELQRRRLAA